MNLNPSATAAPFMVAVLGIASFASMDAVMKILATDMGAYNALLWRTLMAFLIAAVLFLTRRQRWPARPVLKIHLLRGALTSVMAFLFFWGLVLVPLAEAIGLSFIAPLIALYLAAVLLGEKVGARSVLASILGFVGALVIIGGKLGGEYSEDVAWGIAAILVSALLYAYNLILQRQQALVANPFEIAVFQNGTVCFIYALFAPFWAVVPQADQLPVLMTGAVLGIVSVLLISWAYARASASILIPIEYTAFVWAALLGWLLLAEAVTLPTIAGTALIVTGCLIAARQQPERAQHVETTAV